MSETVSPQEGVSKLQEASGPPQEGKKLAKGRPRLWARLLLLLGSTAVGLGLAEMGARLFVAVTHRVPLIVSDPHMGWALQPNLRNAIRGGEGGQFVISTDAEGHRLTRRPDEGAAKGSSTALIVGDSFIMSTAVDDHETFAWILAHEMDRNVVNLAVLGYGTDQELVSLEAYLEAHPAVDVRDVVVFVAANDFTDVQKRFQYLGRSKPCFQVTDGRLDRPSFQLTLSDRLMDVSYLYWLANSQIAAHSINEAKDPPAGSAVIVACLAAMRQTAARRGARLHVLAHHLREQWPATESWWKDFCRRAGGTDITERLRPPNGSDPFSYDRVHWSPAVHQRVAAIVKERLEAPSGP
jgi:hypothetical protein